MKKTIFFAGLLTAVILGAAALVWGNAFTPAQGVLAQEEQPGGREMVIAVEQVVNGETFAGTVRVTFSDPDVLPQSSPDAGGLFLSRQDRVLTLGTGAIEVVVDVDIVNDQAPTTTVHAAHSGGEVVVHVTGQTVAYLDVTGHLEITPADIQAGMLVVPRTVVPGSLDDLAENTLVTVWGAVRSGALVADVLLIEPIR